MSSSALHKLDGYSTGDFDRGAPRWKEALWVVARCVFFEPAWPWPSSLRVALLRAFGARVGRGVVIRSRVHVSFPWRLTVGDHVWLGEGVFILSLAEVVIGPHTCISQQAMLCTGSHDWRSPEFSLRTAPIRVGAHAWVAVRATLLPGTTVGEGAVVAAGAVVRGAVEPGMVVAGNPAQVIGRR